MKYMLLIYGSEQGWAGLSDAERGTLMSNYRQFGADIKASGNFVAG
jgi:hypothetical protein